MIAYNPPNPPYSFPGPERKGVFKDIFTHIGQITGDQFELIPVPVARGLNEFDRGRIDIEPGVNPKWRQHVKERGIYSISYAQSDEVIVFKPGHHIPVLKAADLFGEKVGVVRGFSYPKFDAAFSSGLIERVHGLSEISLAEQMLKGRIKQIFIGRTTFLYLQGHKEAFKPYVIGDTVSIVDVMMRLHPSKAELLPRLNKALLKLKQEGQITRIYQQYF